MLKQKSAQRGVTQTGIATVLAASQVIACVHVAGAAEGLEANLSIATGLEHIDSSVPNNRNAGTRSLTTLGFGLRSETRTQKLDLQLGTDLVYGLSGSEGFAFDESTAALSYSLESRNSLLRFDASYSDTDLDNLSFEDDDGNLTIGDGSRDRFQLRSSLELGREGPVSAELRHQYTDTGFSGTADPDLLDSTTHRIDATLSFELSPVATVSIFAFRRDTDEDGVGSVDQLEQRFGLRGTYEFSEATRATAELSYNKNRTRGAATRDTNGIGYALGLEHDRPNGQITLDFSEETSFNGKRREIELGRSFEGKRGDVSLSFGLSKADGLDTQPFANITARYELDPRSQISISLRQTAVTDDDVNESLQTRLDVDYNRELTQISSISAGFSYDEDNVLSGTAVDQSTLQLTLGYRHELGSDWGLVSNYEYRSDRQDGRPDRETKTLFIGLEKNFAFRP